MATVDVVIPNYNYGHFLHDSVGSVLSQQGVDVRVLIIDNCSTDKSAEVARELARSDSRVEFLAQQVNRGATASYNDGIDWAASEYFLILDADDMLAPGALARSTAILDRHPDVVFTDGKEERLDENGFSQTHGDKRDIKWKILTGMAVIEMLCRTPICNIGANTVVRRTDVQKKAGYYRDSLPYTDDLEMWLRLATFGSVAHIATVQAYRRYHGMRHSAQYTFANQSRDFLEREAAFVSFFKNEGASISEKDQLLDAVRLGLGEQAYWSAVSHFFRGYRNSAIQLMRFSREKRKMPILLPPFRWLLKMDRPVARIVEILAQILFVPLHNIGLRRASLENRTEIRATPDFTRGADNAER